MISHDDHMTISHHSEKLLGHARMGKFIKTTFMVI